MSEVQQERVTDGFRLSPQQRRLWLLQRDSAAYRVLAAVSVEGDLDLAALRAACEDVVRRNDILRTSFRLRAGASMPTQVVHDGPAAPVGVVDLTRLNPPEQEAAVERLFSEALRSPLRPERISQRRLTVAALSARRHVLLVELPALCADYSTLTNLLSELARSDAARPNDGGDERLQYGELSAWLNELLESEETRAGREYWLRQPMAYAQPTHLPFEKRPAGGEEFAPRSVTSRVGPDLAEELRRLARREQTTLPALLLAGWQILLWRLTGKSDVLVGVACDGRRFEETRDALGMLTRYLPVQSRPAEAGRLTELLKHLDERTKEVEKWQEYFSWERLDGAHANGAAAPFFSVLFDFHQLPAGPSGGGLTFSLLREYVCLNRFKVKLSCAASADGLDLQLYYDPACFDADNVERVGRSFRRLLQSLCAAPETPFAELDLLDEVERRRLLVEFNRTDAPLPSDECVQQLFEEQAGRTPERVALMCDGRRLTYAELNARANRLAHLLRKCGVGPEVCVGLCLDRTPEVIVGLLAILKAGGAYVPLNHEHPRARLGHQLAETGAPVLLTQEKLLDRLPHDFGGELICLDRDRALFEHEPETNPPVTARGQNLVYVIYTSGSTGVPKGVAVTPSKSPQLHALHLHEARAEGCGAYAAPPPFRDRLDPQRRPREHLHLPGAGLGRLPARARLRDGDRRRAVGRLRRGAPHRRAQDRALAPERPARLGERSRCTAAQVSHPGGRSPAFQTA